MKHTVIKYPLMAGMMLTGFGAVAVADDTMGKAWTIQAGLVAAGNTSYYKDVGEEGCILPLIIAEYKRLYFHGVEAGYSLYQWGNNQEVLVVSGVTFDGYNSNDSDYLSGMEDRDKAWEIGFAYKFLIGGGELEIRLMNDLGTSHEGYSIRVDYEHELWSGEKHMIAWYSGLEYWDESRTDYYFGVKESEALPDRAAYSPSGHVQAFTGLNAVKKINSRISLIANTEYRTAGATVSDSPITSRNDQLSGYLGIFTEF